MNTWFESKVRYEKLDQRTGKAKKVTEAYLLEAITFSEAEERVYKTLEEIISGEFIIKGISKSNISEVYPYENGDRWWKCKLSYMDIDAESGREKKFTSYLLVTADTAKEAIERVHHELREMIVPFSLSVVSESPIVDVFPFKPATE